MILNIVISLGMYSVDYIKKNWVSVTRTRESKVWVCDRGLGWQGG